MEIALKNFPQEKWNNSVPTEMDESNVLDKIAMSPQPRVLLI